MFSFLHVVHFDVGGEVGGMGGGDEMPPSNLHHNKFICHRQKRLYLLLSNTFFVFYFFTVLLRHVDDEHRDAEMFVSRAAASQLFNLLYLPRARCNRDNLPSETFMTN